jgi:hypothetical protein
MLTTLCDEARLQLAWRLSYVLPRQELLELVRLHSPLVELGAGTGYWAYRLRLLGADIVAYDVAPVGGERENRYHPGAGAWTDVLVGDLDVLANYEDRALFICWPPAYSTLWEALRSYRGPTVIYVGDWGGRTARLEGLRDEFEVVETHSVLAVDPAPDQQAELSVWKRKRPQRIAARIRGAGLAAGSGDLCACPSGSLTS